jgi:flagellar biosynthesis/type III secretory pathway protein FliH
MDNEQHHDRFFKKVFADSGWLSVPEALLISVHAYALRLIPAVDINSLIEQINNQKEDTTTMSKFVSMAEGLVRKGRREGRREGRKMGWSEGMQQGRDAGMQQGLVEGKRQTLLTILQKRFGTVSPELQARISTADSDVLDNWTLRALEINSIEELG